jgi:hypothetical protein
VNRNKLPSSVKRASRPLEWHTTSPKPFLRRKENLQFISGVQHVYLPFYHIQTCATYLVAVEFCRLRERPVEEQQVRMLRARSCTLCNEGNTCGSGSTPCTVDVKRTPYSASSVPRIQNAKSNALFCVHSGVKMTWLSTGKNIGFVVDIGPVSPFEPEGTIIGGSERSVTVVAHKSGCYKYSAGACMSGAINGMCGQSNAELVIIP